MRRYVVVLCIVGACEGKQSATSQVAGSGSAAIVAASDAAPTTPADATTIVDDATVAALDAAPQGPLRIVDFGVGHAVLSDGRIRAWGGRSATPREVGRIPGAVQLDGNVAVLQDGRALWVQRKREDGTIEQTTPIDVPPVKRVVVSRVSGGSTYFVGVDGSAIVLDKNRKRDDRIAKLPLANLVEIVDESCALDAAGAVHCWSGSDVEVEKGIPPSKRIVEWMDTVCSVARDGGLHCWRPEYKPPPAPVAGFEKATDAAASIRYHVDPITGLLCAIVEDGQVTCARIGETAPDKKANNIDPPKLVSGLRSATRIAVDRDSACALVGDELRCWGQNDRGQLGDGTRIDRETPVVVAHLLDETLPPPRDGFDAVPESSVPMSWAGLPAACKRSPTLDVDKARFDKPAIVFEVRSAYAFWNSEVLHVRLASYLVDPSEKIVPPRGAQQYIDLWLKKLDTDEEPLKTDRGTYSIGDSVRELRMSRWHDGSWSSTLAGDQEVVLTHLDTRWACGTFRRYDLGDDKPIVSTFAARIIASPKASSPARRP